MSSLLDKYSNWQIYGFFGLFLNHSIWTYYLLTYVMGIPFQKDPISYMEDILPTLGIYVVIPFAVSLGIWYRMYKHQMLKKSNYFVLLLAGFCVSLVSVVIMYFQ